MNVALCAVSLASVSYGSDDVLKTPVKSVGMLESVTPSGVSSARSSVAGSPMRVGYQRFEITDSTTDGDIVAALIRAKNEIFTSRKRVIDFGAVPDKELQTALKPLN